MFLYCFHFYCHLLYCICIAFFLYIEFRILCSHAGVRNRICL